MSRRRHSRAPLRRSSVPERILSAGLATATCVGVVGLLGARTIEANTNDDAVVESTETVASQPTTPPVAVEPTTANGLTQADLDAYAAALAKEKDRLDAYRAKLEKTARKLAREVQAYNAAQRTTARSTTPTRVSSVPSQPTASSVTKPKAAKPAAPSQPAAAPAPKAQPAPAPQPAPKPQSNTKGS